MQSSQEGPKTPERTLGHFLNTPTLDGSGNEKIDPRLYRIQTSLEIFDYFLQSNERSQFSVRDLFLEFIRVIGSRGFTISFEGDDVYLIDTIARDGENETPFDKCLLKRDSSVDGFIDLYGDLIRYALHWKPEMIDRIDTVNFVSKDKMSISEYNSRVKNLSDEVFGMFYNSDVDIHFSDINTLADRYGLKIDFIDSSVEGNKIVVIRPVDKELADIGEYQTFLGVTTGHSESKYQIRDVVKSLVDLTRK